MWLSMNHTLMSWLRCVSVAAPRHHCHRLLMPICHRYTSSVPCFVCTPCLNDSSVYVIAGRHMVASPKHHCHRLLLPTCHNYASSVPCFVHNPCLNDSYAFVTAGWHVAAPLQHRHHSWPQAHQAGPQELRVSGADPTDSGH